MKKDNNMNSKEVETWNFNGVQLLHISENNHSEENNRIIAENLKHIEPDVILFELPRKESVFDELNALEPGSITPEIIDRFRNSSIKKIRGNFNIIIDCLEVLWHEKKKKVLLHRIDAPIELTSYCVNLPLWFRFIRVRWYCESIYTEHIIIFKNQVIELQTPNWNHLQMSIQVMYPIVS